VKVDHVPKWNHGFAIGFAIYIVWFHRRLPPQVSRGGHGPTKKNPLLGRRWSGLLPRGCFEVPAPYPTWILDGCVQIGIFRHPLDSHVLKVIQYLSICLSVYLSIYLSIYLYSIYDRKFRNGWSGWQLNTIMDISCVYIYIPALHTACILYVYIILEHLRSQADIITVLVAMIKSSIMLIIIVILPWYLCWSYYIANIVNLINDHILQL
jgi:hypothetical protein